MLCLLDNGQIGKVKILTITFMVKLLMFSVLWGMRTTGECAAARSLYTNTKSRSSPAAAPAALVTAGCRLLAAAPWMPRTQSRGEVLHFNHSPSGIPFADADQTLTGAGAGDSLGSRLVIAGHPLLSPPTHHRTTGWTNFYVVET